jgi:hypothetical protein
LQHHHYNKNIMASPIKAIPTLEGEDAIRFREEMEANEQAFRSRPKKNRDEDPFIIKMREVLRRSGL